MATKTKAGTQIYAILGNDESEVRRAAKEWAAKLATGDTDFGSDIIDGHASGADDAASRIHQTIEALLTFPFFGGEKLVWLKNANFLSDTVMGRANGVLEALEKLSGLLAAGLPENIRFLVSAIDVDKRRTFYKSLGKVAKVELYEKLDISKSGWEEEAATIVRQFAADRGLSFEPEALDTFALFTGGDRRAISNELEKLALYQTGENTPISAECVRLLVPMSKAGIIWELGNAISEQNVQRALDLLDRLLFQGDKAIGILLVAIIPTVRNLLLVKDLMARHRIDRPKQPFYFGRTLDALPAEATAHLPRKKEGGINGYALGLAAQHVQRHELSQLRASFEACLAANVQLVTSQLDPKTVLSQLLIKITRKPAKPRK